ncbi:hypothetical protein OCS_02837 [Ophiocordyceps sinensis CO18]|uniref:DNA/RNA-binding domain-containing protein n=1 Tax=Ophiocordyceps sinensis (strain Co18 / CGMCC 3.14243) TaxID=911162 RepID=T5AI65_OPHSC|nr:hypothetical protein OCS_02837 [Ophiocordyceps sinensis CO18]
MDQLTKGWVHHLRKTARQTTAGQTTAGQTTAGHGSCPLSASAILASSRSSQATTRRTSEATGPGRPHRKRPTPDHLDITHRPDARESLAGADANQRGSKKICSPPASVAQERSSSPPSRGRSRARLNEAFGDFNRGHVSKPPGGRQLWNPDNDPHPKPSTARPIQYPRRLKGHRQPPQQRGASRSVSSDRLTTSEMIRQPETQQISQEQLVAEVKGIYTALVMIESRCIEFDNSQQATRLSQEQYHALISLHRSVLHEHHDFFLASQHPSASDTLRRLASKYAMPARMWRHGIHSFLELLRHKLPGSLEHMLNFIYIAYSMMALLFETVPAFEDTWIECLGDLGRYRMAIEDDDIRDRETWTGVSRYWYSKASDKSPTTGRLYHHLAILSRPSALQQLYYYAKSLCVPIPFPSARESVLTLFDPLLSSAPQQHLVPVDAAFVRVHGILFSGKSKEQLVPSMDEFCSLLDGRIGSAHSSWLEAGYINPPLPSNTCALACQLWCRQLTKVTRYYVGISLSCSLLGFGAESNVIMRVISRHGEPDDSMDEVFLEGDAEAYAVDTFRQALCFAVRTYEIVLRRWGDKNTLSCLHTTMVFLLHLSRHPCAMAYIENDYPWKLTAIMLNHLLHNYLFLTVGRKPRIDGESFPGPEKEGQPPYPLPEDYALRGLIYTEDYFPDGWFDNERIDESDRYLEPPSKALERQERILWIGRRLATSNKWLTWDEGARSFSVAPAYDGVLDGLPDNK